MVNASRHKFVVLEEKKINADAEPSLVSNSAHSAERSKMVVEGLSTAEPAHKGSIVVEKNPIPAVLPHVLPKHAKNSAQVAEPSRIRVAAPWIVGHVLRHKSVEAEA